MEATWVPWEPGRGVGGRKGGREGKEGSGREREKGSGWREAARKEEVSENETAREGRR